MYFLKDEVYMGRIWANVLASIIFGLVAFNYLRPYITFQIKSKHIKYLLVYSIPLMPAYLSNFILSYFDRIMINSYVDSASAGLYSFAYNIAGLQYMFSNAIVSAWTPKYFELINEGANDEHDKQAISVFKIISAATIVIIIFAEFLGKSMSNESYYSGLSLIPIIVLGQYFITITVLYKNGVSFEKKTWLSTIAILVSTLINIALNWIFIPEFGMIAAAYTTLAAYICQALLMIWLAIRFLKVHSINPSKLLLPTIYTVSIAGIIVILPFLELSTLISIVLKIALSILSVFVLLRTEIKNFLQPIKTT
jgi:O-antigen/teichoic acid export membrane protein